MNIEFTNKLVGFRKGLVVLMFSIIALPFFTQIKKGDKMFSKFEYEKALRAYEKEYNENTDANPYLTRRIGLTYRNLGDIESSAIWFKRTLDLDQSNSMDYLYYAEALKFIKEYDKSVAYYRLYNEKSPNDSRAIEHLNNPTYYQKLLSDTSQFTINRLKMNSENASFGITKYHEKYLFSSTGTPNPEVTQSYNMFEDNPYLDIFSTSVDEEYEFVDVERLKGEINSKYHDGPSSFDGVNNQLYITRNNIKRKRPVKDGSGKVNLKIYVFDEIEEGEWGKAQELPFNSDVYSVAHPSISPDGNTLFFSSNQVGGYGGTDLYKSSRTNGGTWGEPLNLGPQINTEGDESFPYISAEGNLFFSSDGHPGLGGLDIFKASVMDGRWMDPINLAHPINSEKDDIGFVTDKNEKNGYFSSNRAENQAGDDIYSFVHTPVIKVNAFVKDKYTMLPIEGVIAKIYDEDGYVVFEGVSDENGYLEISITKGKCNYILKVGENMDFKDYDFDLSLCDEELANLDLGVIEFGEMEYNLAVNVTDMNNDELSRDVMAEIYDLKTQKLVFESSLSEDGVLDYGFKSNTEYRIDIKSDDYNVESQVFNADGVVDNLKRLNFNLSLLDPKGITPVYRDYQLALSVRDVERQELVADAYAKIYDLETKELIFESIVAADGILAMSLQTNSDYRVDVSHKDYIATTENFSTRNVKNGVINVKTNLKPKTGDVPAIASVDLENIYYNFDKSNIRNDAKKVLDKLVVFMNSNPEIKVDMDSHTDSRGTNSYNMKLSDRREESVMNYLLKAGIDASRLSASHHGEEQLANNCGDKVKCSENAHQLNRRTTFMVLNPEALASKDIIEANIENIAYNETNTSDIDFDFILLS